MIENESIEIEQEIADTTTDTTVNTDESAASVAEPIIENPIEKLEQDLAEQKDKYLRLMAEFENYKRRTAKERMELVQTAGKDIIVSMLYVLDDVDRAEKQLGSNDDLAIQKEGIQLVFSKIDRKSVV